MGEFDHPGGTVTLIMDAQKYHTTVRMDGDLAERLGLISQVRGQSKNSLIVAAVKQFVLDLESDPTYLEERTKLLERWSGKED